MNQQEQTSLIYSSFLNNFSKPDYTFEAQAEEESMDQFSEGGIGFEYVRDLHSDLSSAMARHSLN